MGALPYPQIGFNLPPAMSHATDSFYSDQHHPRVCTSGVSKNIEQATANLTPVNIYGRENENIAGC